MKIGERLAWDVRAKLGEIVTRGEVARLARERSINDTVNGLLVKMGLREESNGRVLRDFQYHG